MNQSLDATTVLGTAAVVLCGLLLTAALVWAVRFGTRVRRREQAPGRLPPQAPAREPADDTGHRQRREPNEVPRTEGRRPNPHELGDAPDRPSGDQGRPRW
ncbi:hypothetical protein IAG44_42240 [Streptomyces roseirectus]|uniref:Secreted protein n=1 Tax=Streptomyces roseirectus TaxID=2768066 RepID=A0A7H0IRG2_9ACTN|nr:DUF6479 family protein [Streptomyces roseirectus]QNP75378.1 hypothetical protein IAG44_42240 [Streptomyces roseirectus]